MYARRHATSPATVVHSRGLVLDCCDAATNRGVRTGAPLSEAKAILRSGARYVEYREADYTEDRDRWLGACLLYSSRIEHETPASAWIDLSQHPSPGDVAARLLSDLWHQEGLPIAAAVAPAKWLAKVAARLCDPSALFIGVSDAPMIECPASYLAALPTRSLTPVAREHRQRLEFLGYRRIGDVQNVPLHLLSSQFGGDAVLIHQAAHGRLGDPVVPNFPRRTIERYRAFEGCVHDRQTLVLAMREVALEVAAALSSCDSLALATETVLGLESGSFVRHVRRLPRPSTALTASLLHQLERTEFKEPVASLRVAVPELCGVASRQATLEGADRAQQEKAAGASAGGLRAAFGDATVRKASQIELPRRRRVLRAWSDATGWR